MNGFRIYDFKLLLDMDLKAGFITKSVYDSYMHEIDTTNSYNTLSYIYGLYMSYMIMYMNN